MYASEMTYIVSGEAINSTHSLTASCTLNSVNGGAPGKTWNDVRHLPQFTIRLMFVSEIGVGCNEA